MINNNYELIKQAIHHKKSLTCLYDGEIRHFCPYTLGKTGRKTYCHAYQFGGNSVSKGPITGNGNNNWRCFDVSRMTSVTISDKPWVSRNDLSGQTCVNTVDVWVAA